MSDAALKDVATLFSIIRAPGTAKSNFLNALPWFNKYQPSSLWSEISPLSIERDVLLTKSWIIDQFNAPKFPRTTITGVYFGLDTLNMRNGQGKNIEIGGSTLFNHQQPSNDWPFHNSWYGEETLVKGLFEIAELVKEEDSDLVWFSDFYVWMTYTGLILIEIFETTNPNTLLTGAPARNIIFGHHDGDLCSLGTLFPSGFKIDVSF